MEQVKWQGAKLGLGLLCFALLVGCINREEILQGKRVELRSDATQEVEPAVQLAGRTSQLAGSPIGASAPISLPATQTNANWTHAGGNALHRLVHPALSAAPTQAWNTSIGAGDSRRHRISASPVVANGRVFTLDAKALVQATSTGGDTLWRSDLTPASENRSDVSGGGLAFGGDTLFVTTGFGTLTALDPATGAVRWEQFLDAPATSAPSVRDGLVYVVTTAGLAWAINSETGRIAWQLQGLESPATMLGGAGPAISDRLVFIPFGSEELVASFRRGGVRRWDASVSGDREGAVYATITDITATPVVDGARVYSGNQSGRTVALDANTGARIWSAPHGAYGEVWPEGEAVFLVNDQGELVRLNASDGTEVWRVPMPYFENSRERRRKAVFAHYGPVVAGARVRVVSSDGLLRSFDPESGALVSTVGIPGGATAPPAVAGGTLYVVSKRGQLHAFR